MKKILWVAIISTCLTACYNTHKSDVHGMLVANTALSRVNKVLDVEAIGGVFTQLSFTLRNDPEKVKPFYDRAVKAKQSSDTMYNYIQGLKLKLMKAAYNVDTITDDTLAKYAFRGKVGVMEKVLLGPGGLAHSLKLRLATHRRDIMALLIFPRDTTDLNIGLLMPDKNGKSWEEYEFADNSLLANIVVLTELQNKVRICEFEIEKYIISEVSCSDCFHGSVGVFFGKYTGNTEATKEDLESIDSITLKFPAEILKFDMTFILNGKAVTCSSNNAKLTPQMEEGIAALKPNDIVIIQNVRMKWGDDTTNYYLHGATITIRKDENEVHNYYRGIYW